MGLSGLQKDFFSAQFGSNKSGLFKSKDKVTLKIKDIFTSGRQKIWRVTHSILYVLRG